MKRRLVALVTLFAIAAFAQGRNKWERVESLHPNVSLELVTDQRSSCRLDAVDEKSLTCGNRVYARNDIRRIYLTSDMGRDPVWSMRTGALIGVGLGAAIGAAAGWRGAVILGALGLPIGAATGTLAGLLFLPHRRLIYVRP